MSRPWPSNFNPACNGQKMQQSNRGWGGDSGNTGEKGKWWVDKGKHTSNGRGSKTRLLLFPAVGKQSHKTSTTPATNALKTQQSNRWGGRESGGGKQSEELEGEYANTKGTGESIMMVDGLWMFLLLLLWMICVQQAVPAAAKQIVYQMDGRYEKTTGAVV